MTEIVPGVAASDSGPPEAVGRIGFSPDAGASGTSVAATAMEASDEGALS